MIAHAENKTTVATGDADQIVRLIRRICLLRETGRIAEADRLEKSELPAVIDRARPGNGSEAWSAEAMAGVFAAEKERAANAVVLSELIVAQLLENFPAGRPSEPAAQTSAANPPPSPTPPAGKAPGGSPAIPDLLDAMLAHDRSAARQPSLSIAPGTGANHKTKSAPK